MQATFSHLQATFFMQATFFYASHYASHVFTNATTKMLLLKPIETFSYMFLCLNLVSFFSTHITCRTPFTHKHLNFITSRFSTYSTKNIYKCFVNLPWSFVVKFEIASKLFLINWCTFAPKYNLNKHHSKIISKQWRNHCLKTDLYLKNHLQNVESKNWTVVRMVLRYLRR